MFCFTLSAHKVPLCVVAVFFTLSVFSDGCWSRCCFFNFWMSSRIRLFVADHVGHLRSVPRWPFFLHPWQ
uniref:Putative secreted protein n=1 Tax=Ixodes ricinus TaxID=34613 RepID=A0A6B0TXE0_IXORI